MGTTKISAVLDRNLVVSNYSYSSTSKEPVSKLKLKLWHQYTDAVGSKKDVLIKESEVPADALVESYDEVNYLQEARIFVGNPTYFTNLFVQILDERDGTLNAHKVPVLEADDDLIPEMPRNPIKPRDFHENQPLDPDPDNAVSYEDVVNPVIATDDDLVNLAPPKARLDEDSNMYEVGGDGSLLPENAGVNLFTNSDFVDSQVINGLKVPTTWSLDAPGFMLATDLVAGGPGVVNTWSVKVSNPNIFNAFDTVSIRCSQLIQLPLPFRSVTTSIRYRLQSDGFLEKCFQKFVAKFDFYDSTNVFITTKSVEHVAVWNPSEARLAWQVLAVTLNESILPINAHSVKVHLQTSSVDTVTPFKLDLLLPQFEPEGMATTPVVSGTRREQDRIDTTKPIKLATPLYIACKTLHEDAPQIRGIVDSTTALKDGIQFYVSSNHMFLKALSPSGSVLWSKSSSAFSVSDSAQVTYGVHITSSAITFYLDGIAISTHPQAVSLDQMKIVRVGSLLTEGTALNTPILDFVVAKIVPT
jgi:hypothetical protein